MDLHAYYTIFFNVQENINLKTIANLQNYKYLMTNQVIDLYKTIDDLLDSYLFVGFQFSLQQKLG